MTTGGVSSAHRAPHAALAASASLADRVFAHAERTPQAPAIASPAVRLTYRDLADRVRALAGQLAGAGVGSGTRVMMALPNAPATVVVGLALNTLGAVSLECNREWSAATLGGIAQAAGVHHAFLAGRDLRKWSDVPALAELQHLWVLHKDPLGAWLDDRHAEASVSRITDDGSVAEGRTPSSALPEVEPDPDQPALVLYTSGSLGRPLGVIQTLRNIESNSRSIVDYLGLTEDDRAMLTLPLHYCYGRSVLQTHLMVGGSVFLDHRMAFPRTVLETIAAEGCTGFAGVPLTFEVIRRQVDVSTLAFPRLRYLTQAGGAMSDETIAWVRQAFSPARLFVMYGQTEATARLSYLPPERAPEKPGSIGIAIPGVELKVVDPDGREMPPGELGEIVARGPNVTPGYLDEPESTARILRDGWLWTGDLAVRDGDGYLYHRGRAREILKVGGQRVSPTEIEQVLTRHADVAEAVVIGQPDDLLGEVPVAVIVTRDGVKLDQRELRGFLQDKLASRQLPARIVVVPALPRNSAGKPMRAEVARRYRESLST